MIVFGLTGNIACGKSTVSKTIVSHGIPMIDADIVARQIVVLGSSGLSALTAAFGKQILKPDGTLDRPQMAELVFSHPDLELRASSLSKLNAIMGPLIQQETAKQLLKLRGEGCKLAGYDAALLIETGSADKYRPLIVVACSQETQIQRLMLRNNLDRQRAMDIIATQMTTEQKESLADYVIDTDGTIEQSIAQTVVVIAQLNEWL